MLKFFFKLIDVGNVMQDYNSASQLSSVHGDQHETLSRLCTLVMERLLFLPSPSHTSELFSSFSSKKKHTHTHTHTTSLVSNTIVATTGEYLEEGVDTW